MRAMDMDYDKRDEFIDFQDDSGADEDFDEGYGEDFSDDFNDGEFW